MLSEIKKARACQIQQVRASLFHSLPILHAQPNLQSLNPASHPRMTRAQALTDMESILAIYSMSCYNIYNLRFLSALSKGIGFDKRIVVPEKKGSEPFSSILVLIWN
jgi:hypothetical protein